MSHHFLSADDLAFVEQHTAHIDESDLDGFWRFWDHERIRLDGDFTLAGLQALVNAMAAMKKRRQNGEAAQ